MAQQYHLIKTLGTHPRCQVELIEIPSRGLFVLKRYAVREMSRWKMVDLVKREIDILQKLPQTGFPKFDHFFELDGAVGLCYHYIPGRSLQEMQQWGDYYIRNEYGVIDFLRKMAQLLKKLHRSHPPIIHRDIKPANIIIGVDEKPSIIDFSGSVIRSERGTTVIGTPGYTAPEQLSGRAVPGSDLYALGATVIYLITGQDPEDLIDDQLRFNYRGWIRFPASKQLCSLIDQLTDPYLEARFQNTADLLGALNGFFPDHSLMIPEKKLIFRSETRFYPHHQDRSYLLPIKTAYLPVRTPDSLSFLFPYQKQFAVKILSGPFKGAEGMIDTESDTYRSLIQLSFSEKLKLIGITMPLNLFTMMGTAFILIAIIYSLIFYM